MLTALGVFWGIFMLIVMLGAGDGLKKGATTTFAGFASNALFVWEQRTTIPYRGLQAGRSFQLDMADIRELRMKIPELDKLAPRCNLGNQNVSYGGETGSYDIRGEMPEIRYVNGKRLLFGRFINHLDVSEKRKVVVLGKFVYRDFFKDNSNPVGKYIKIQGVYYQIVGITEELRSGGRAEREEMSITMPVTTLQKVYNRGEKIDWFICTVDPTMPPEGVKRVEEKVKSVLRDNHRVHPKDTRAIGSWNTADEFQSFQFIFNGIDAFIWFAGVFTMIAGVVGVGNIMLIVVKERTTEIGLRKALGATPASVIGLIMQESVFLTTLAGYSGLLVGVGLIYGINTAMKSFNISSEFFMNPQIDLNVTLAAMLLLVVTGMLAGLIPSLNAARISPVEALRDE